MPSGACIVSRIHRKCATRCPRCGSYGCVSSRPPCLCRSGREKKDNGLINIIHIFEFSKKNQLKLTLFGYWSSYLLAVLANEYVLAVGLESPFRALAGLARGFGPEMKLEVKLGASNVFAVRATHFFLNKDKTPLTQFRFAQSNYSSLCNRHTHYVV